MWIVWAGQLFTLVPNAKLNESRPERVKWYAVPARKYLLAKGLTLHFRSCRSPTLSRNVQFEHAARYIQIYCYPSLTATIIHTLSPLSLACLCRSLRARHTLRE